MHPRLKTVLPARSRTTIFRSRRLASIRIGLLNATHRGLRDEQTNQPTRSARIAEARKRTGDGIGSPAQCVGGLMARWRQHHDVQRGSRNSGRDPHSAQSQSCMRRGAEKRRPHRGLRIADREQVMSKMALEQIREWMRDQATYAVGAGDAHYSVQLDAMADAIDAELKARGEPVATACDILDDDDLPDGSIRWIGKALPKGTKLYA